MSRVEMIDLAAPRDGLSGCERFLLEMADVMVANKPERAATIEVRREIGDDEGQSLSVFSPGPRWFDKSIMLNAYLPGRRDAALAELIGQPTRRWKFHGASIIGNVAGKPYPRAKTYRAARSTCEVWSR